MQFYFILILQGYCIYHLIKNRNNYYWIFLILFVPIIGSIIYIITQVYNKRDINKISKEISSIVNPTKKITDLEHALQFSETFQNRVNLADAYFENKDFLNAIKHYECALNEDHHVLDFAVINNLMRSHFEIEAYQKVIDYGESIKSEQGFQKSSAQFIYGLALEKLGRAEEAESYIRAIDKRYSNYEERLILAKFLIAYDKSEEGKELLNEIYSESQYMTDENRRIYRKTILEVEKLRNS